MVEITNKWPAVRISGPQVTESQAIEYIWKTDKALDCARYRGNSKDFEEELIHFLEGVDRTNCVDLEHLDSRRVYTARVGGPYGLISPEGKVELCVNFGKWPEVEDVEGDLEIITKEFPWLEFDMYLWDSADESAAVERGDLPTMGWKVKGGTFRYIDNIEKEFKTFQVLPAPDFREVLMRSLGKSSRESGCTWSSMKEIQSVFSKYL